MYIFLKLNKIFVYKKKLNNNNNNNNNNNTNTNVHLLRRLIPLLTFHNTELLTVVFIYNLYVPFTIFHFSVQYLPFCRQFLHAVIFY